MEVLATEIADVRLLRPKRHGDHRGWFVETYRRDRLYEALGRDIPFPQDNCSFSAQAGTVRGLHFQSPPAAQAKLIGVLGGAILDVAVDLRHGSPSFGRHVAEVLSAENGLIIFIPEGFAHGFATLAPDTLLSYKVSAVYSASNDLGLFWQDPDLGIDWRVDSDRAVLSDKDRRLPRLADLPRYFTYGPT